MSPTDRSEASDQRRRRCERKTPREGMAVQHTGAPVRFCHARCSDVPALCGREPGVPGDSRAVGVLHRDPQPGAGPPRGRDLDARRAARRAGSRRRRGGRRVGAHRLVRDGVHDRQVRGSGVSRPARGPQAARTRRRRARPRAARPGHDARLFWQGAVVNILNPKTALFFLAFLPQFVDPSAPVAPQMLVLGTMLVGLGVLSDGTYALVAAGAGRKLRETACGAAAAGPVERRRVRLARAGRGAGGRAAPQVTSADAPTRPLSGQPRAGRPGHP